MLEQLNFIKQCRKYDLTLWQCPNFLIIIIGLVTIIAMLGTYAVAIEYAQPEIVALIVIGVTAILFIIGYLVLQSFEKLAQANRMKSEFVSIVSHQLRTPLTSIKWTLNLMMLKEKDSLTKEQLEKLITIKESNQRMVNLVNDLLNISRIEQGQLNLKPEKISLEKTIQDLIKEYSALAKASNIEFSLKSEFLPLVLIDKQGIELILRNLIDNAVRYTKGKGLIKIKLIKKNNSVRCEIQDSGVGIPNKDKRKIFQKFFRSQNIMKYQTQGTGLGLFIAKSVINASKGSIGFQSQENKGSTFWFELPIKKTLKQKILKHQNKKH
ncbi:MAG: HAMP domain-containing histidine kinase [Parcubacteria group bacterium]|nr:HAMP domain-containing histidine kinase [Parcubacteria group bacterium]